MQTPHRRLGVLYGHLRKQLSSCSTSDVNPRLTIHPSTCLVDEQVQITLHGLAADQVVTLACYVEELGSKFEARGVYRANKDGAIDSRQDPSLAGTFTGVEPMGLFWSLRPASGQDPWLRLVKKDVTTPLVYTVCAYAGSHADKTEINGTRLARAVARRLYKSPSVRRILVREGKFRGTIFLPEGKGPFPGLIDAYGAMVSAVESRASLLASHGYVTFALSYLYQDHLPKHALDASPGYFKEAAEWFSQQKFVDEERLGAVGLCYGGFLLLVCAAICPKIKAVVNINGLPMVPPDVAKSIKIDRVTEEFIPLWAKVEKVYTTDEGIMVDEASNLDDPKCIQVWQHGAKVLTICGLDDKQVKSAWHDMAEANCPKQFRGNMEWVRYPGAGHLLDPPYTPLCRVIKTSRERLATIGVTQTHLRDLNLMAGGFVKQHAHAQEDAWARILEFLEKNLKHMKAP